jgi:dolichol-phosphate mannosyltransferase
MVTRLPIFDSTGGFNCYRKEVLEKIDLDTIISDGYAFQIEMKYRLWEKGFYFKEVPITFIERARGTSKISKRIIFQAFFLVWKLLCRGSIH